MSDSSPPPSSLDVDSDRASVWIDDEPDVNMQFPPLPHTVARVSSLVAAEHGEPDTQQLARIVNADPVIAATVLQRINSAYYGMRRRVTNVRRAVMMLGFLDVANVVLTAGLLQLEDIFADEDQERVFTHIMETSIGAGQLARETAAAFGLPSEGPAYSAGLLHSAGRLIFLHNAPDDYTALRHADDAVRLPSIEAETRIFGTNHAVLGAHAADRWRLPMILVNAIRFYSAPDRVDNWTHREVATLVGAAVAALNRPDDAPPLSEAAPIARLANHLEVPTRDVVTCIDEQRPRVRDYVSMMMPS